MKNLTTHVPNYTQIYFPYSSVTSACQGSRLACTRTRNNYSKSIATKLVYQRKPIDTLIYEKFVCYNHETKYTD